MPDSIATHCFSCAKLSAQNELKHLRDFSHSVSQRFACTHARTLALLCIFETMPQSNQGEFEPPHIKRVEKEKEIPSPSVYRIAAAYVYIFLASGDKNLYLGWSGPQCEFISTGFLKWPVQDSLGIYPIL